MFRKNLIGLKWETLISFKTLLGISDVQSWIFNAKMNLQILIFDNFSSNLLNLFKMIEKSKVVEKKENCVKLFGGNCELWWPKAGTNFERQKKKGFKLKTRLHFSKLISLSYFLVLKKFSNCIRKASTQVVVVRKSNLLKFNFFCFLKKSQENKN